MLWANILSGSRINFTSPRQPAVWSEGECTRWKMKRADRSRCLKALTRAHGEWQGMLLLYLSDPKVNQERSERIKACLPPLLGILHITFPLPQGV